jgi:hypothetical protein
MTLMADATKRCGLFGSAHHAAAVALPTLRAHISQESQMSFIVAVVRVRQRRTRNHWLVDSQRYGTGISVRRLSSRRLDENNVQILCNRVRNRDGRIIGDGTVDVQTRAAVRHWQLGAIED